MYVPVVIFINMPVLLLLINNTEPSMVPMWPES